MIQSTWSLFGGERNIESLLYERVLTIPKVTEGFQIANRHCSFCGTHFGEGGVQAAWLSAGASFAQVMQNRNRRG